MVPIDRLIRSNRRSLSIELDADGRLTVRAPKRLAKREIDRFVQEKADWIAQKQALLSHRPKAQPHRFVEGERFYYLGRPYRLCYENNHTAIQRKENRLVLPEAWREDAEQALRSWYRRQAKEYLTQRLGEVAQGCGLTYSGVRITSAQTRWGSCSAKNGINLTWYLIMAPPRVIDSVLIHELCHTVEHNHSAAFWRLVTHHFPDYEEQHRWLAENRQLLRLITEESTQMV